MKILELFSGYGTSSFALKQLGIPYELIGYSDIDKYANQCFKQNHCPGDIEDKLRLGDVKQINPDNLKDFDLLTGGFPCQPFSVAGKRKGELDVRGTLFYEIIRIAEIKKPKYMLLENVKGLTNKTFKETFNKILSELDRIGYNVYWKVLNTKDFGIPQSRARVWFVCFRKDIDNGTFQFPQPFPLTIFIKDILEEQVDKKYYLSEKLQERFSKYLKDKNKKLGIEEPTILDLYNDKVKEDRTSITLSNQCPNNLRLIEGVEVHSLFPRSGNPNYGGTGHLSKEDGTSYAVDTGNCQAVRVQNLIFDKAQGKYTEELYEINEENNIDKPSYIQFQNGHHSEAHRVYNSEGISQTLKPSALKVYDRKGFDSRTKGFRENELSPTLSQKMGTGGNNVPMVVNDVANTIKVGGRVTKPEFYYEKKQDNFVSDTITTAVGRSGHSSEELGYIENNYKCGQLRRLTPKECFRLQGFLNDEVNLTWLSDTQCYKLAGNGQSVNVVKLIFKEMFKYGN